MRPTNLCYRSPKEKTGEFDFPIITTTGDSLWNDEFAIKPKFFTAERFLQYKVDANRLPDVGPGTYELRKSLKNQKFLNPVELTPLNEKNYVFTHKIYDLGAVFKEYEEIKDIPVNDFQAKIEKKVWKTKTKPKNKPKVLPYLQKSL